MDKMGMHIPSTPLGNPISNVAERCGPLENERLSDAQNSTGRKQAYGTTEQQHVPLSWKKKDGTKEAVVSAEGRATSHRGLFPGLDTMDSARLNSGIAWEWCFLFFSLLEWECL